MSVIMRIIVVGLLSVTLTGCGGNGLLKGLKGTGEEAVIENPIVVRQEKSKLVDLFANANDPNVTLAVNKYIWNASLDVLNFLPVEGADPFSGVIVMGWGRAKGSNRQYRATVYIQDAALDARSLRVALVTRGGPANRDTVRAIEDAILTRARQLRIADGKL